MADDIERFLNGAPVLAAPPTMRYRIGKFAVRYKTPIAASAVIVVLLLAGILISTWLAVRARAAEQNAAAQLVESQRQKAVAQQERDQAHEANQRAALSEQRAVEEATNAKLLAHYVSAQYMSSQGRLAPAYQEITAGIRLRPQWEEGYFLYNLLITAREHWQPVARIQTDNDSSTRACFVGRFGQILAVCNDGQLKLFSAASGQLQSQTQIPGDVREVIPMGETALAVSNSNLVTIYQLDDLSNPRTVPLDAQTTSLATDPQGKYLAVYCKGGSTVVFDAASLKEVARHAFKFVSARSAQNSSFPGANGHPAIRLSPSGQVVLFYSGLWNQQAETWRWSTGEIVRQDTVRSNFLNFADENTLVGFQRSSDGTAYMSFVTKSLGKNDGTEARFFSRAQDNPTVWREPPANGASTRTLVAATSPDSLDLFSLEDEQLLSSDRFGSLFPGETSDFQYRAFDPRLGLLAVGNGTRIDLFQSSQFGPGTRRQRFSRFSSVRFWSIAASSKAMFGAWMNSEKQRPVVRRTDFSEKLSSEKERLLECEWPSADPGKSADVWGIAVTPDEKTVALLWQENSGGGNINAEFYRKAILVYQFPASASARQSLPVWRTIWLDKYAGINGRDNRPIILAPDGQSVVFVPNNGRSTIYRVSDGTPIAEVDAGAPTSPSPDGSLLAGGSFLQDSPVRVWDTSTGKLIFTSAVSAKARRLAITSDNRKLYVGWQTDNLECFDLRTGQSVSKINTRICPVAISPTEDRFIGFLPDSETIGSEVLASLSTGKFITVLNEGAHILNQAHYSPDGNSLAISLHRDVNGLAQNLSIADAEKQLDLLFPLLMPKEPASQPAATTPAQGAN